MASCGPLGNQLCNDEVISIKDGSPSLWISDDIILSGPIVKGIPNPVTVRARRDVNKTWNPDNATVSFELFVSNPSLTAPTPKSSDAPQIESTKERDITQFSTSNPGGTPLNEATLDVVFNWMANETVLNPRPGEDPNNLHRCLIARCYRTGLTAPTTAFNVVEDPHVAQRNLVITPVSPRIRRLGFLIETNSQNLDRVEAATIRAIADRVPSEAVLNAILPSLKQFKGFRQIAQIAPERFALQVPERFAPIIRDQSRPEIITPINPGDIPIRDTWRYVFRDGANFGRFRDAVFTPNVILQEAVAVRKFNTSLNISNLRAVSDVKVVPKPNFTPGLEKLVERAAPTFEADIKLPPQEVANFTFTADLPENSQTGDAHIFHVMHINEQQQVIGGLTIVAVVVDSVNPELVDALNNQRNQLVKNGYFAIFGNQPGTSSREIAVCLRDLNYAFEPIIECCRQGSTQPLDQIIPGLKETFSSLGFPTNWFITFYQFIKQNHGLTDAFANIVNPYLDHAINLMS